MIQGDECNAKPKAKFEFVNYNLEATDDKGSFRVTKRSKSSVPNIVFRINKKKGDPAKSPTSSISKNSEVSLPDPNYTFATTLGNTARTTRKPSYTITILDQRIKLVELIRKNEIYKQKPQIDAWILTAHEYNKDLGLKENEGLTSHHAKAKFHQILKLAESKLESRKPLDRDESEALCYNQERLLYQQRLTK